MYKISKMANLGHFFQASLLSFLLAVGCQASEIKFSISHFNDVSAQVESFKVGSSSSSKAPVPCLQEQKECIGGLLNVVHWLQDTDAAEFNEVPVENRLIFGSGNLIGGESGWLPYMRWDGYAQALAEFVNPNVTALGQKEFGAGLSQTNLYAKTLKDSIVGVANTCNEEYTGLENTFCNLTMGTVVKRITMKQEDDGSDHTIGVIGFVSELAERLALPGLLKFSNIPAAIKAITADKQYANIKTFIAVGDGSLETAQQIIDQAPKVRLVVYGSAFSNTKNMTDKYPEEHSKGLIATAGRYGSSVGKMKFSWNPDTGVITNLKSKLVVTEYPKDGYADLGGLITQINSWKGNIKNDAVGHTRVNLEGGEKCWQDECNLGNLMADAVVHCVLKKLQEANEHFKYPLHSIYHGGAFFEDTVKGGENISTFDIHKWLPYHNNVYLVKVLGENLLKVFNESATGLNPAPAGKKQWRQFLQVSNGVEVYYTNKSKVPVVTNVRLVHDGFGVPRMGDLNMSENYYLAIPTYLYEGRGIYDFAKSFWTDITVAGGKHAGFDDECLKGYIDAMNQISIGFEERIWIDADPGHNPAPKCPETKKHNKAVTVILTIIFTLMFLAVIYVGYFYVLPRLRRPHVEYPPNQL